MSRGIKIAGENFKTNVVAVKAGEDISKKEAVYLKEGATGVIKGQAYV
jgi:hypothetical protein